AAGGRAEESSVLPVERFGHERNYAGAATSEQDGVDGHTFWILPLGSDNRTLLGWCGETRVGMGGLASSGRRPGTTKPVHQFSRLGLGHRLPPDIALWSDRAVGEYRVAGDAEHGVGIGLHAGAGRHAEESVLGVDGVEAAIGAEFHPRDVITDRLDFPTGDGWDEHGKVGLAAGRREGSSDVLGFAGGGGGGLEEDMVCPAGVH